MRNLVGDPKHAVLVSGMKARFWNTRKGYGDTDESVWKPGATKRFRPDDYIRQPRQRKK